MGPQTARDVGEREATDPDIDIGFVVEGSGRSPDGDEALLGRSEEIEPPGRRAAEHEIGSVPSGADWHVLKSQNMVNQIILKESSKLVVRRSCTNGQVGGPSGQARPTFCPGEGGKVEAGRFLNLVVSISMTIELRKAIHSQTQVQCPITIWKRQGAPMHAGGRCFGDTDPRREEQHHQDRENRMWVTEGHWTGSGANRHT